MQELVKTRQVADPPVKRCRTMSYEVESPSQTLGEQLAAPAISRRPGSRNSRRNIVQSINSDPAASPPSPDHHKSRKSIGQLVDSGPADVQQRYGHHNTEKKVQSVDLVAVPPSPSRHNSIDSGLLAASPPRPDARSRQQTMTVKEQMRNNFGFADSTDNDSNTTGVQDVSISPGQAETRSSQLSRPGNPAAGPPSQDSCPGDPEVETNTVL